MNDENESGLHDLRHFLRLAGAQLRHRIKESQAEAKANVQTDVAAGSKLNRMKMLEELIKEQVPNEDSRHPAR